MVRDWVLELGPKAKESRTAGLRLWIKDSNTGKVAEMVPQCASLDEFRNEISQIKLELDRILDQAQHEWDVLAVEGQSGKLDPQAVWREMESYPSQEEMFAYFNSFREAERMLIAEYILSQVNMFKGRGPVFSEHYDGSSHILE